MDQQSKVIGEIQKRIAAKFKAKENPEAEQAEKKAAEEVQTQLAEAETAAKNALDKALHKIGNIVHQSVPVSKDEVRHENRSRKGERPPFVFLPFSPLHTSLQKAWLT